MRRTSSQTSLSTDSALNSKWYFADTTRLRVSNGHDSPRAASDADDLLYDDDIFGSAAWRKKRGKKFSPRASPNGSAFAKTGDDSNHPQKSQDTGNETWFNAVGRWVSDVKFRMSLLVSTTWPLRLAARRTSTVPAASAGVRQQGGRATGQGSTTTASNSPMSTSPAVEMSDISNEALVQQTQLLCGNYIYQRLSSKGLMNKRVVVSPYHSSLAEEIFSAGQELERLYPRVYSDVSRRISMTMTSAQLVRRALTNILETLFRADVTWAKIVSMIAIAGAFAEECVVQGHPNFVEDVVVCVGHFVSLHLTSWLAQKGGWAAFPTAKVPKANKMKEGSLLLFIFTTLLILSILIIVTFSFVLT